MIAAFVGEFMLICLACWLIQAGAFALCELLAEDIGRLAAWWRKNRLARAGR